MEDYLDSNSKTFLDYFDASTLQMENCNFRAAARRSIRDLYLRCGRSDH